MKRYFVLITLLAVIYGCESPKPAPSTVTGKDAIFQGTVGSVTELTGYADVRVRGYSLVLGLMRTGSSECPPSIKTHLLQQLRKLKDQKLLPPAYTDLDAESIISSRSTAVVTVEGLVPAGAPKREKFDVNIRALEGTQTTSLQGGILIRTELQIVVAQQGGRIIAARPTAIAAGPVFINPFPRSTQATQTADPRSGVVLGGGRALYDRHVQLALLQPDYRMAQQLQSRINSRFVDTDSPQAAEATRSKVTLRIPQKYRDNYQHFFSLVWALYLQDSPGYLENKLRDLSGLAKQKDADFETISLAWEAIGRPSLAYLQPLYSDASLGELAFYAARTALNLDDLKAIDALITMALDEEHPSQLRAAQELGGQAQDLRARQALVQLLDKDNYQLRMVAYEGLRRASDTRIRTHSISRYFELDVVNTTGENLICAWTTGEPRIVLFGKNLSCPQNIFLESDDKHITINAKQGDNEVSISRQIPNQQEFVILKSSFAVEDMIKTLVKPILSADGQSAIANGLNFSEIVGLLYKLCRNKMIPAVFKLHRR
jgi:flagellar basal body P-ring protein FlgI